MCELLNAGSFASIVLFLSDQFAQAKFGGSRAITTAEPLQLQDATAKTGHTEDECYCSEGKG